MAFTDEQLKDLKEYCALDGIFRADSIWIDRDEAMALLARLSAAEEFIRLGSQEQSVSPVELRKAEATWRKASGKEPKA